MNFDGRTLRDTRLHRGETTEVFAAQLGVTPALLEAWEAGTAVPSPVKLLTLAIVSGEDLGFFTGEHGPKAVAA